MPSCIVHNCQSGSNSELCLFKFPSKLEDAERRKLWEEYADQEDVPDDAAICELHFSEEQFELNQDGDEKLLKWDAVPDVVYVIRVHPEEDLEFDDDHEIVEIQLVDDSGGVLQDENVITVQNKVGTSKKRKMKDCTDEVCNNSIDADVHNGMEVEIHAAKKLKLKNKSCLNTVKTRPKNVVLEMKEKMLQIMKKQNLTKFINGEVENKEIQTLKEELKVANEKIETLENLVTSIQDVYKKVFNEDQNRHIVSGSTRGACWSEETMNKALRLYKMCGASGYEEILCQNLPYPSLRTLHRYRGDIIKKLDAEKET